MTNSLLSNPTRLLGLGVVSVALLFAIIATATTGWIKYKAGGVDGGVGLFQTCAKSGGATACVDTIDLTVPSCNTQSELESRVRASQAFAVLSILIGAASVGAVILGLVLQQNATVGRYASPVAGVAAFLAGGAMLIAFAVHVDTFGRWYGCGNSLCSSGCTSCSSCGYNFSLGLAVVSWIFFFGASVVMFLGAKSAPVSDEAAPPPPALSAESKRGLY